MLYGRLGSFRTGQGCVDESTMYNQDWITSIGVSDLVIVRLSD